MLIEAGDPERDVRRLVAQMRGLGRRLLLGAMDPHGDPVSAIAYIPNEGGNVFRGVRTGASVVVQREKLIEPVDALNQSLDYYAAARSAYSQRRIIEINDGKVDPAEIGADAFSIVEKSNQAQ